MITIHIKKAFYEIDKPVISDFNMSVSQGEIVAVVGQSGVGKSTLLKIMAGLHKNYEGELTVKENLRLAFIPQNQGLLPWKTVYENIVLLAKTENRQINKQRALELINSLGLGGLEKQYPHRLSGGQYKRAALGQAFFYEPDIILMDEPFSGLDGTIKKEVQDLFMRLQKEKGITTIFVTHDMAETIYMGGRVVRLGIR